MGLKLSYLFDVAALASGAVAGYNEGKGIPMSAPMAYGLKLGPTALSMGAVAGMHFLIKQTPKVLGTLMRERTHAGELYFTKSNGDKIFWENMNEEEKEYYTKYMKEKESEFQDLVENDTRIVVPTLRMGARTSLETLAGYLGGRVLSTIV